ncbi:MAG: hypothetical protein K8L99_08375 [Anaerolineae bacterium]|nr:hypothetical protein [Anaerolineae bacterium]
MTQRTVIDYHSRNRYPVKSVTKLETMEDGTVVKTVLSRPKKRRVSKRWRRFDKALRRVTEAQNTASAEYLKRHERSNQKKKNGAVRDLLKNTSKAQRKGLKKLKIFKL